MLEETDSTSQTLLEALEDQKALLNTIREKQDSLHELMENTASRLNRLDQEHTVLRTWFRRMEERFDRRLRERVNSMDERVASLESSRR